MRKLIDRMLARLGYVRAVVAEPKYTVAEMSFAFGQREALARFESYHTGFAQGELMGRMALHREIAAQYGVDGGEHNMTTEDVLRIGARQIH